MMACLVGTIVTFPPRGTTDSSINALAGYTKRLLNHLSSAGRSQHVVFSDRQSPSRQSYIENGYEVVECWDKGQWREWLQIIRCAKGYPGVRVLHLQHEFNLFGGALTIPCIPVLLVVLRSLMRRRIVVTLHEVVGREMITKDFIRANFLPTSVSFARAAFRWYYPLLARCCDVLIVHDESFRTILREEYHVRTPVHVIPIGVEPVRSKVTREEARSRLGVSAEARILLFFGFVSAYKGLDLLCEAFERLQGDYRLFIVGGKSERVTHDPQYMKWYDAFAKKVAADARIKLCGFVDTREAENYFVAADLLVLPYLFPRSMSAVMATAMAYGTPFIASDAFQGKIPDEMLFARNAEALHAKLRWAFEGHLRQLADDVRSLGKDASWETCAAKTEVVYQELLRRAT